MAFRVVCALFFVGMIGPVVSHAYTADTSSEATADVLETIVVTAEKRSENLVNTPVSIGVVSGQLLQNSGITDVSQIGQVIPGVRIDYSGASVEPSIRGVTTTITGQGFTPNIVTYVDGVYRPNSLIGDYQLLDVSSVEVLKGPQGTLFGRNATGGAIYISSLDPSHDATTAARFTYGNYNTTNASVFVTGGLTDTLAASVAAFTGHSDGYIKNLYTGGLGNPSEINGVRVKFLYTPADYLSVTLGYEHFYQNDPTGNTDSTYRGWTDAALIPGTIVPLYRGQSANDGSDQHLVVENVIYLKAKADFGWSTLTSISSYISDDARESIDLDATSAAIEVAAWHYPMRTISQEFDLASSGAGPLTWITGLNYYRNDSAYNSLNITVGTAPPFEYLYSQTNAESYAAFADATYNFLSNFYFTAGVRYSYDHIDARFNALPTYTEVPSAGTWQNGKPRAILRYALTPDSNVYASFSEGYKSAAFNPSGAATAPVQPEEITAYEVGYKIAKPKWQLETAAYYYDYKDLQVESFVGSNGVLTNAASAKNYGFDAHLAARLTQDFTVDLGGAYTHARFDSFPEAPSYTWNPAVGVIVGHVDASGFPMIRSPTFQGNIGLTYEHSFDPGTVRLSGNYAYQSKLYFDPALVTSQSGYGVMNLRLAWTNSDKKWTFAVYGNNVTDKTYITQILAEPAFFGAVYGMPATFGGEVQLHY